MLLWRVFTFDEARLPVALMPTWRHSQSFR